MPVGRPARLRSRRVERLGGIRRALRVGGGSGADRDARDRGCDAERGRRASRAASGRALRRDCPVRWRGACLLAHRRPGGAARPPASRSTGSPASAWAPTSAGCSPWAWTPSEIDARCYEEWIRRNPIGDYTLPRRSLIRGDRALAMLKRTFGEVRIEELPRGFLSGAAELRSGELVVSRWGPLWDAVATSFAIPALGAAQIRRATHPRRRIPGRQPAGGGDGRSG